MTDYDFNNLNDKEFEVLANDLVSKKEEAVVDRYKPGKDGGVDGRFFTINGEEVIIQSKHWIKSGISALIRHLKKNELPKVVRRHINWNTYRPDLREDLVHLVQDIKQRICGIASAGSPSF